MEETTPRRFRDSASFGKRMEYIAVAQLLKRNFDVYMTLVDDQQIDCVLRGGPEANPRYIDVQIKARSKDCKPNSMGRFAAMRIKHPRPNLYFLFYSECADLYWVMCSMDVVREATSNKNGKHKGKYSLVLTNYSKRKKAPVPRPRFKKYEGNFDAIREALDGTVSVP